MAQVGSAREDGPALLEVVNVGTEGEGEGEEGRLTGVHLWGEGASEHDDALHDFGDVISSQKEINDLRSQLGRLQVECQHWKQAAASAEERLGVSP